MRPHTPPRLTKAKAPRNLFDLSSIRGHFLQSLFVELERIASRRAFQRECDFPELGGDYRICRYQENGEASTRALCFVVATGPPKILRVEFVGAPFAYSELMRRGLELSGFVANLFDFQDSVLESKPDEVLPANIRLKAYDLPTLLSRIESELERSEPQVWPHYFALLAEQARYSGQSSTA